MRKLLVLALVLGLVGVAAANDLSSQAPVKPVGTYPVNVPNPILQGGDNIGNATLISTLPYNDNGTTSGYNDDFAPTCPFSTNAPDVVYMYTPASDELLDVSLCGSFFDTVVAVYDAALTEIACNDDDCGLQSTVRNVSVAAGSTYYIVVDGYNTANGNYVIDVIGYPDEPCVVTCTGYDEGEVDMYDGYVDEYNGGCNSASPTFQAIVGDPSGNLTLCGNSGFFNGSSNRDTDWFSFVVGPTGTVELEYVSEEDLWAVELTSGITCPPAQGSLGGIASHCNPGFLTITGIPGTVYAIVMVPPTFGTQTMTWDYQINFTGLAEGPVATEATTWGTLKAMYQ